MVSEEKVKQMTHLAIYEEGEGKDYLPLAKYHRRDYIGLQLTRTFIYTTLGYGLATVLWLMYCMESLWENFNEIDIAQLATTILLIYALCLVVFLVITFVVYNRKYTMSRKSLRGYYEGLKQLNQMYTKEEKTKAPGDIS